VSIDAVSDDAVASVAAALAQWAAGYSFEDIPVEVANEAKRCLLDATGVAIAGSEHPIAILLRDQVSAQYGAGPCSIIGGEAPASPAGAALANGTAAHVLDFDDVSYEGMVHATAVVWPAVLAAAELVAANGRDSLTAFVAAVEAEYALGRAFTHDLFWRGWWTTGLLGALGAAVGASKVLGATPDTMQQAISIAACQTSGPYVLVGSPVKPVACGRAAELGVQAALLAEAGMTAPEDAFENPHGLIAMFGDGTFQPNELEKLGNRYVLSTSRVAFKRYPVCAGAQSGIEALVGLMQDEALASDDVVGIRCEVTPDVGHYMAYDRPQSVSEAQFSLPFCLACAAIHGDISVSHLDESYIQSAHIRERMKTVSVIHSEKLAAEEAASLDVHQPARVTVLTRDRREASAFIPAPTGMPANPMSDAELDAKFIDAAGHVLSAAEAERLKRRLRSFETLASTSELLRDL
tara:strand:+ start:977 stop:2371 length:1395 start_codon:yes stop_codon:yes gene_type:complete